MTDPEETYISYLLRLRKSGAPAGWRATLINPNNGEIITFSNLKELVRFIYKLTGTVAPAPTVKSLPPDS